jgi:hypothetical protein
MTEDLAVDVQALEYVIANPEARRELLWLRAREKGDDWTISDLRRVDPQIEARLQLAQGPFDDDADFGSLYDDCLERHLRRFSESHAGVRKRGRRTRTC